MVLDLLEGPASGKGDCCCLLALVDRSFEVAPADKAAEVDTAAGVVDRAAKVANRRDFGSSPCWLKEAQDSRKLPHQSTHLRLQLAAGQDEEFLRS